MSKLPRRTHRKRGKSMRRHKKSRSTRKYRHRGGFDVNSHLNAPGNYIMDKIDRMLSGGKRRRHRRSHRRSHRRKQRGGFDVNSHLNAPGNYIMDKIDRMLSGGKRRKHSRRRKH